MKSKIPIRNIYYMLAYAHNSLQFKEFKRVGEEEFENVLELYATILSLGVPTLIRAGLLKEYRVFTEQSGVVRGKINLSETVKSNSLIRKKLVVSYDQFSEDNLLNQIIKATLEKLRSQKSVNAQIRKKLFSLLPFFSDVSDVQLNLRLWDAITYSKQNMRYNFMVDICRYAYEQILIDQSQDDFLRKGVEDERKLSALYEKFVYEFYRKESPYTVTHRQINWLVNDKNTAALPKMQTDIVLNDGKSTLIIDTKFYSANMARSFESAEYKQLSSNLYQMFAYLNNWSMVTDVNVGGMILYAKTSDEHQPNHSYWIKGQSIVIEVLDLDQPFNHITDQLMKLAKDSFDRIRIGIQ